MTSTGVFRVFRAAAVIAACAAALALCACAKPPPKLAFLFEESALLDDAVSHEAPARRPRREPYKKPAPQPVIEVVERPPPPDWGAIYAALPRNPDGEVQWVRALADKAITPKPTPSGEANDDEPTDIDIELVPKDQPELKVVFSHKTHTMWLACTNCHTGIFEMEHGKAPITMERINDGEYCGACHGKVATPDVTGCPRCHTAMAK